MAITRLLQTSTLCADDVERISSAYEAALRQLGLTSRNDPITEIVAEVVIEVAKNGPDDPLQVCALAMRRLKEGSS
jgi:uncharacterized protein